MDLSYIKTALNEGNIFHLPDPAPWLLMVDDFPAPKINVTLDPPLFAFTVFYAVEISDPYCTSLSGDLKTT